MPDINKRIAVLTSGGDAPGMNAAVRAIVRTGLEFGMEVYAINEGYQGMVHGGDFIHKMSWDSVGGILHKGGTIIGTARSEEFKTREGRLKAAHNLLEYEIDALAVIGGDGSLTGADIFRHEWPGLLQELVQKEEISPEVALAHPFLAIVGLVGSIDNDMYGTDMTIGADSALHRITDAVDAITSTASSHQRAFVVEVMGRNSGYLALMSALASGADWVLIPESPPMVDNWEEVMIERLKAGRRAGRRDSIVIVAEGARDRYGKPISATYVTQVLAKGMGEEVRETILGHVQRGGRPSAFDRNLGTLTGYLAVETLAHTTPEMEPQLIGIRGNRLSRLPLMYCVEKTREVAEALSHNNFDKAMELRGPSFIDAFRTFTTFVRALPHPPKEGQRRLRLGVMNAGALSPGMNPAVRAAVRLIIDKGHIALGIRNGFEGLIHNDMYEMQWMSVNGWVSMGGSELGTNRKVPVGPELYQMARTIETQNLDGLLIIGGWTAYESAFKMLMERKGYPAFNIPIVCLPATIDNNLPGSELSIGADTALNTIVQAVDKIKQSAVAAGRVFVVEVMGRYSGYLALMCGLANGAERVYIHEEGITLKELMIDVENLCDGFKSGKRLGLIIRNEFANPVYNTPFLVALFEEEGGDIFDVRQAILGYMQQGGDPSPFDRIQSIRLADYCVDYLIKQALEGSNQSALIGYEVGKLLFQDLENFPRLTIEEFQRPKSEWWLDLRPIAQLLSQPFPHFLIEEGIKLGEGEPVGVISSKK